MLRSCRGRQTIPASPPRRAWSRRRASPPPTAILAWSRSWRAGSPSIASRIRARSRSRSASRSSMCSPPAPPWESSWNGADDPGRPLRQSAQPPRKPSSNPRCRARCARQARHQAGRHIALLRLPAGAAIAAAELRQCRGGGRDRAIARRAAERPSSDRGGVRASTDGAERSAEPRSRSHRLSGPGHRRRRRARIAASAHARTGVRAGALERGGARLAPSGARANRRRAAGRSARCGPGPVPAGAMTVLARLEALSGCLGRAGHGRAPYARPIGIVSGETARDLIGAGAALPLAGGGAGFLWLDLWDRSSDPPRHAMVAAKLAASSPALAAALARIGKARPALGGLAGDWPVLMGVINVTPDSFSDAGEFAEPGAAVDPGLALLEAGAPHI